MLSKYVVVALLIVCTWINGNDAYRDNDLTVLVAAGRKECFYQSVKSGQSIDVEYQVIDGGELDIDFRISAPSAIAVVTEFRKNDGIHTIDPTDEGDYEVCFDNTFSRITSKTIFFEIIIDNNEGGMDEDDEAWKKFVASDETYGDKLASLEVAGQSLDTIKSNNAKITQYQVMLRAFEAKDRNIVERNFMRINFWSLTNIVVMLSVFALQIFMVRNMFNDKKKVRT
ncbi:transmembrane emp24 domain-containing protein 1-like isoform X1 [Ciona intestinalis]